MSRFSVYDVNILGKLSYRIYKVINIKNSCSNWPDLLSNIDFSENQVSLITIEFAGNFKSAIVFELGNRD